MEAGRFEGPTFVQVKIIESITSLLYDLKTFNSESFYPVFSFAENISVDQS